uniref:Uncharacterized protein n=1 Tax=Sparus aurata TaxID=8175 RepID=A0A671YWI3_SPAAU
MVRGWWARYSTIGVIPYPSLSMRALHLSSIFMMSRLPDSAQSWRAVFPFTLLRLTSAPRSRRNLLMGSFVTVVRTNSRRRAVPADSRLTNRTHPQKHDTFN